MEKPERARFASDSPHVHPWWVPQARSQQSSVDVYTAEPTPTAKNKPKSPPIQVTVTAPSEDSNHMGKAKSQLPSNPVTNSNQPVIHILSLPTPTKVTSLRVEVPEVPTPSPRCESFIAHEFVMPDQGRSELSDSSEDHNPRFPRLMTVVTAFIPNLADELSIEIGEPVRMLDEYRDGWCLVQRVGKVDSDAPKGVVPRFCLNE
jgi:hypothetical protein